VYDLEYGKDALEIHADAIERGQRVLIVDDVLATGGTAAAATELVKRLGGELHALAFLIELQFLNGRSKIAENQVFSVLQY
jgi:adenine phosphoribosyltransferase